MLMIKLNVGGIEITAEKKYIKNMYIRVVPPDGKVRITAPMAATEDAIRMFAESRISWIEKQRKKFVDKPRQAELRYVTGESFYLWGNRYYLNVVYSSICNDVALSGQRIFLQVRPDSTPQQRANVMDNWYREILKEAITPVFEKCERLVGVSAREWQIKNMRTRWGTCNVTEKTIWLNLQLAKKPPECLEYVIVHELVHLLEKSHNDTFRAYMDRFYPNWRTVKARLNEQLTENTSD
jgi:predicted metal-dependent hydrolase